MHAHTVKKPDISINTIIIKITASVSNMVILKIKLHGALRGSSALLGRTVIKHGVGVRGKIWHPGLKHLNLIRRLWNIPQLQAIMEDFNECSVISLPFSSRSRGANTIRKTGETKLSLAPGCLKHTQTPKTSSESVPAAAYPFWTHWRVCINNAIQICF